MRIHDILTPKIGDLDTQLIAEDVWHGSPHRIEQFSTDFISTGEGEQAFGYGLYFTSSREVGIHYRDKLASKYTYKGKTVKPESMLSWVIGFIVKMDYDKDKAANLWKDGCKQQIMTQEIDVSQIKVKGHLYNVHLPDSNEYLLWDEPFAGQSSLVQGVMARMNPKAREMTGEEFYWSLCGPDRFQDKEASLSLLANGVHGIKYYDGYSRGSHSGSYNYVIFDGIDTKIKKRYS